VRTRRNRRAPDTRDHDARIDKSPPTHATGRDLSRGAEAGTPRRLQPGAVQATQLYALAVPSRGGDTLFANGYAAYDGAGALKAPRRGDRGVFLWRAARKSRLLDAEDQEWIPVYPPIVRTHPETGANPSISTRQDRRFCRHRA